MILLALLLQSAAPAAAPLADNVQLACTVASPGAAPANINLDLKTKKLGVVAVVADGGPLARASSTSAATPWAQGLAFTVATGNGQYRMELMFDGAPAAGKARARVVALGGEGLQPLVGQGFCGPRSGKRLPEKKLVRAAFDATPAPGRAVKLQPGTPALPVAGCRVVAADRSVHRVDYTVLSAAANEASVAYKFDGPAFVGSAGGTATGVLFHLATPQERLFALTVSLGGEPALYVHQTFEESGIWIDIARGSTVLALGECGTVPAALLATPAAGTAQ